MFSWSLVELAPCISFIPPLLQFHTHLGSTHIDLGSTHIVVWWGLSVIFGHITYTTHLAGILRYLFNVNLLSSCNYVLWLLFLAGLGSIVVWLVLGQNAESLILSCFVLCDPLSPRVWNTFEQSIPNSPVSHCHVSRRNRDMKPVHSGCQHSLCRLSCVDCGVMRAWGRCEYILISSRPLSRWFHCHYEIRVEYTLYAG